MPRKTGRTQKIDVLRPKRASLNESPAEWRGFASLKLGLLREQQRQEIRNYLEGGWGAAFEE